MKTYPNSIVRGARFSALAFLSLTLCSPVLAALSERDRAAIRAVHDHYAQQVLAKDWTAVGNARTDTAIFMIPNGAARSGRREILDWHAALPPIQTFSLELQELDGSGDLAFGRGRYALTSAAPNQPEQIDGGKYLQVWRKQRDGTWKIDRDIFNSDLPLPGAAPSAASDEQAIAKIEQDWAAALVRSDVGFINTIVAPEWVYTGPDGMMQTKAQADEELRTGVIKFASWNLDELKVRVHGDSAIVLGVNSERSTYRGKDTSGQYRFTDVFARRGGQWLCVVTHASRVEPPAGDTVAAIKDAIEKHYAFISRGDDGWKAQHTQDMSLFSPDFDRLMRLNSASWLAALASRGEHVQNWKARDIDVQTFGHAAVATFHMDGSITRKADGSVDSRPRRVTEVWVNENGTWKEAHHHDSVYLTPPKAAAAQ